MSVDAEGAWPRLAVARHTRVLIHEGPDSHEREVLRKDTINVMSLENVHSNSYSEDLSYVVPGNRSACQAIDGQSTRGERGGHSSPAGEHALGCHPRFSQGGPGAERGPGRLRRDRGSVWFQRLAAGIT